MADQTRLETKRERLPLKENGKIKSKAVVEAMDGCKITKLGRSGMHLKNKPQMEGKSTKEFKKCDRGITKRTALGNIGNITGKNIITNTKHDKNDSKTRLKKKLQASKIIIGLKGKKVPTLQDKPTNDKPQSLIDIDRKANHDISDVPMEEDKLQGPMEEDKSAKEIPFSLPKGVDNIDSECSEDPQSCAENAAYIITYMRHLESIQNIRPKFLSASLISGKMRSVLINWLAEVHLQFKLIQETLYLTVALVDRYLAVDGHTIKRAKVQLVGVCAMLIACKYEEMYIPQVEDFVYITDDAYSKQEILSMELHMLQVLKFQLGRPLAIHFLRRNSKAGSVEIEHHWLAKYILEACMVEYDLAHIAPSKMAAASLLLSLKLLNKGQFETMWSPNLAYYSGYKLANLKDTIQKIAAVMKDIHTSKFNAAYNKYKSTSNQRVALMIAENAQVLYVLKDLSQGNF